MQDGARDGEKRWILGVTVKVSQWTPPVHLNESWDMKPRRSSPPALSREWNENINRLIIHNTARAAGCFLCEG